MDKLGFHYYSFSFFCEKIQEKYFSGKRFFAQTENALISFLFNGYFALFPFFLQFPLKKDLREIKLYFSFFFLLRK